VSKAQEEGLVALFGRNLGLACDDDVALLHPYHLAPDAVDVNVFALHPGELIVKESAVHDFVIVHHESPVLLSLNGGESVIPFVESGVVRLEIAQASGAPA